MERFGAGLGARLRSRLAARIENRLYYGWVIVAVIFISNLATFSPNTSFGLFVTPFEAEFGWSRTMIATAPTLGTVFGALFAPFLGRFVDRFGVRPLMVGGGLFGGLCYLLLGRVEAIWQLYILYGVMFGVMTIGVGFMVSNVSVTRWFVRRRGRAMATVMMGSSLGGLFFITVQAVVIEWAGWRHAFTLQALFIAALVVVPGLLLLVNTPEQVGLGGHRELSPPEPARGKPEGGEEEARGDAVPAAEQEVNWSLREAMGVPTFWLVWFGIMMNNLMVAGYFANNVPHMEHLGFSRLTAGTAWATFFFVGVIAKFIWGFIVEFTTVRWGLVLLNLGEWVGLYLLVNATTPLDLYVYAVVHGALHGPWLALSTQVWGDYFGRRSIGQIYGTVQPGIVLAGAVGPWLGGYIYDHTGSYDLFYNILMGMMLFGTAIYAVARPPQKRRPAAEA